MRNNVVVLYLRVQFMEVGECHVLLELICHAHCAILGKRNVKNLKEETVGLTLIFLAPSFITSMLQRLEGQRLMDQV